VTGRAIYTDDITLPRMLHAKLKRSIHPHARIRSIDASEALAMPGVHAVITGKDLPAYFGIIPWTEDEQALCEDKARYVGDAIATTKSSSTTCCRCPTPARRSRGSAITSTACRRYSGAASCWRTPRPTSLSKAVRWTRSPSCAR
jgi:xanthine dehydrogenase molybdopterin-binding subunit B